MAVTGVYVQITSSQYTRPTDRVAKPNVYIKGLIEIARSNGYVRWITRHGMGSSSVSMLTLLQIKEREESKKNRKGSFFED